MGTLALSTIFLRKISDLGTLVLPSRSLKYDISYKISDLGTLGLSSRSLKVLCFLGKSLIWGLWPSPPEVSKYYFLGKSLHLGTLALSSRSLKVLYFLGQFSPLLVWHALRQKKRPKYVIATPGNSAPGDCSPNGAGTRLMRQHDANPHVRQFLNVEQRLISLTVGSGTCQFVLQATIVQTDARPYYR